MKPKLIELTEILKQNPEVKERLERLEFGCFVQYDFSDIGIEIHKYIGEFENISGKIAHHFLCIEENKKVILDIKEIGKWITIIGHEPAYHDVLEYLGDNWSLSSYGIFNTSFLDSKCTPSFYGVKKLSPGPLSDQSDETLDEIISLCKNVGT